MMVFSGRSLKALAINRYTLAKRKTIRKVMDCVLFTGHKCMPEFKPCRHLRLFEFSFEIQNFRVQSLEETMRHLPEATPNISLFAHFKDLRTDQRLIVVSCHLYWNWDFDHLRAVQAHYMFVQLFEWIQSIGLSEDSVQIICCGGLTRQEWFILTLIHVYLVFRLDFNSDPTSVAYRMITGRAMRTSHYHKVMERAKLEEFKLRDLLHFFHQKSGRFRSAYSMQQFRPGKELGAYSEPSWTNHVNKFRGKIRKATAVN